MPHNGQRSILFFAETAFIPFVKVVLAVFGLSFNKSYTILIIPSTVIVSFVTIRRHSGDSVANFV